jgi:hypothetical protein
LHISRPILLIAKQLTFRELSLELDEELVLATPAEIERHDFETGV